MYQRMIFFFFLSFFFKCWTIWVSWIGELMYFINLGEFFGHYLFSACFCSSLSLCLSLSFPALPITHLHFLLLFFLGLKFIYLFFYTPAFLIRLSLSLLLLFVRQDSARIWKPGGLLSPAGKDWANLLLTSSSSLLLYLLFPVAFKGGENLKWTIDLPCSSGKCNLPSTLRFRQTLPCLLETLGWHINVPCVQESSWPWIRQKLFLMFLHLVTRYVYTYVFFSFFFFYYLILFLNFTILY